MHRFVGPTWLHCGPGVNATLHVEPCTAGPRVFPPHLHTYRTHHAGAVEGSGQASLPARAGMASVPTGTLAAPRCNTCACPRTRWSRHRPWRTWPRALTTL